MKEVLILMLLAVSTIEAKHPVIGVLTKPVDENDLSKGAFLGAGVVRFFQANGLRVVPLHFDLNETELLSQLGNLNGVLFTGGGLTLKKGMKYFDTQQMIWDYSTKQTPHLPIFGICMGFQALCILAAGKTDEKEVLSYGHDAENYPIPLQFSVDIRASRTFGTGTPTPLLQIYATNNVTLNSHTCSVLTGKILVSGGVT